MSYSRFAIGFSRHRKVARLSDAAFRLWASAIDYAREQLTAGELEPQDIDALPRVPTGKKRSEAIAEIVAVGLWEEVDGVHVIHDFDDWQDSPDEVRQKQAAARERMRRVRATRSLPVRANTERTSPEVLLTTSHSSDLDSESLDSGSSSLQPSSEGSDRSRARAPKKPATSAHVPFELPENWAPPSEYLGVLATKYAVPEDRVLAELPEFRWYWREGNGAGTRSTARGWVQRFGNNVERVAKSGALFAAPRGSMSQRGPARPINASDDERVRARNNLLDDAKAGRCGARAKAWADSGQNLGQLVDELEAWRRKQQDKQLSRVTAPLLEGIGR